MAGVHDPVSASAIWSGRRRHLLALGLLLLAGCGLSEYEGKMAEEQERLRYVDEENKYLEGPLRFSPEKKEADKDAKPILPGEVFLRPPKGIALTADKRPIGGIVYRYRATANNPAVTELFLAITKEPSPTFQQDVPRVLNSSCTTRSPKSVKRPGREPVPFEMCRDPLTGLSFYFSRFESYQLVLAFRAGEAKDPTPFMDYSLGSLALGNAAGQQHRLFQARTPSTSSSGRTAK